MSIDRFLRKTASLASIFPSVAGPAVGGYVGYGLGKRFFNNGELGALLGTVTAGTAGKLLGEKVEEAEASKIPPGAPFALDPSAQDIPAWALQGAQLLKQSSHGIGSIVGPDVGGLPYVAYEGIRDKLPAKQIGKNMAGQGIGILGGGFLGHQLGHLIDHGVGHEVKGPFGVPLSTLLAGLGATIGNVKGLEFANK